LLVDDHTILRSGVARMLKASFPDAKLGEAGNSDEALRLLETAAWDVMLRLGQGDTVKAIAADMQLSIKTVSTYRTRILERLRLKSNTDIVRYCLLRGLGQ
jgi:two-component system invasion response regulator UvrY